MICACCRTYINVKRNHVWRLELRDTEPGSDTSYLMLGAALCQDCAMGVTNVVKTGNFPTTKETKEFYFDQVKVSPLGKENHD